MTKRRAAWLGGAPAATTAAPAERVKKRRAARRARMVDARGAAGARVYGGGDFVTISQIAQA